MDVFTLLKITVDEASQLPAWGWASGVTPITQAALDQAVARYLARWGSTPPPALVIRVSELDGLVPGPNCSRPAVILPAKVGVGNILIYPPPPPSTPTRPDKK